MGHFGKQFKKARSNSWSSLKKNLVRDLNSGFLSSFPRKKNHRNSKSFDRAHMKMYKRIEKHLGTYHIIKDHKGTHILHVQKTTLLIWHR